MSKAKIYRKIAKLVKRRLAELEVEKGSAKNVSETYEMTWLLEVVKPKKKRKHK